MKGSGSVDYRDGVLCWSATDRLLCSLYTPGQPLKVATVLEPGSAVRAGICKGMPCHGYLFIIIVQLKLSDQ